MKLHTHVNAKCTFCDILFAWVTLVIGDSWFLDFAKKVKNVSGGNYFNSFEGFQQNFSSQLIIHVWTMNHAGIDKYEVFFPTLTKKLINVTRVSKL